MEKIISHRDEVNLILFFKILLGITVLTVFLLAIFRDFDHDELEAVHTAWKILNGEVIYIDFFQHHHPFFYYLISPVIWVVGENTTTLLVLRVLMFGAFIAMLWCAFRISDLIFEDKKVAWLATLFLVSMTMFSQKAIEVRPDVPQVLFGLLSILFLYKHIKSTSRTSLYLSAFCMGLSFLFLQKTIFIVAGIGLTQLYWVCEKKFTIKYVLLYWVCFSLTVCPYFLYLIFSGQFQDYLFWNWILNMNFEGSFPALKTILNSFHYNHFIWIFFLIGAVVCFRRKIIDISLLSIILLGTVFLVNAPYRQYFMPFIPLMCAIAAVGLLSVLRYKQVLTVVFLAFIVPNLYYIWSMVVNPNKNQIEKINWVLQQTSQSDYIYDGDIYFNIYRKDIDFFWFSTEPGKGGLGTYKKLKPYTYDIYSSISKFKPKLISTIFINDMDHHYIKENYSISDRYKDIYVLK